jgi:hypothetical protein
LIETTAKISADKDRIEARRGKNIAKVPAARKLLTLVYYGAARRPHPSARPRQGGVSTPDATRARPLFCLTPNRRGRPLD